MDLMIQTYLINLAVDLDRLEAFRRGFDRLGLPFERIEAIDGRTFSEEDFRRFQKDRPRHGKGWLRGQMGCFLSHHMAWQKIAAGPDRFGAIFEDDIHVSDDLSAILAQDEWIPDDADVIRLETSTNRLLLSSRPVLTFGKRKLHRVHSTSWCAGGYILSRKTAQRLIELPTRNHEPSDALLYSFTESVIAKELNILQFQPAPCIQDKYLNPDNMAFSSNIEVAAVHRPIQSKVRNLIFGISPLAIIGAVYRTLRGYKRVTFER
jgi:glycosyl transferase family 25